MTDITEEEIAEIYRLTSTFGTVKDNSNAYTSKEHKQIRTNFFVNIFNTPYYSHLDNAYIISGVFSGSQKLKVFRISKSEDEIVYIKGTFGMSSCDNLEDVGYIEVSNCTNIGASWNVQLHTAYLKGINCNVSFPQSDNLSYATIKYWIDNAINTNPITIRTGSKIYSYLMGTAEPTEQVGGTTEEWQALVTLASEKQISFATT